jgi:beta-lactamase regulating signal transducer with metallopeptidase domain
MLSFIIPFIAFKQQVLPRELVDAVVFESTFSINPESFNDKPYVKSINYMVLGIWIAYFSITAVLLSRFLINIKYILQRTRRSAHIPYEESKIVLLNKKTVPHSFLGYIYLNKEAYTSGNIEEEILVHELAHVSQKHSWDILLVEVLQIFFWFNPFIFLFRKAIALNHEFLADEAVINQISDIKSYRYLLFEKVDEQASSFITSRFNYSITKKRLLMMTKTKSFRNALCRQVAVVPLLGLALFFFSTITIAQEKTKNVQSKQIVVPSTTEGATPEQLAEYREIVNKAKNDKGRPAHSNISESDKERLKSLYLLMNREQQSQQMIVFMSSPPPMKKKVPTEQQIESWKDSEIYGVWIDEKRISNADLDNYTNTDFGSLFVSKLAKNAKNYGKHYYQVDLMTNDYYAAYYKKAVENQNKYIMGFSYNKRN